MCEQIKEWLSNTGYESGEKIDEHEVWESERNVVVWHPYEGLKLMYCKSDYSSTEDIRHEIKSKLQAEKVSPKNHANQLKEVFS